MEEKEYSNIYAIPANYTDSGKLLGGMGGDPMRSGSNLFSGAGWVSGAVLDTHAHHDPHRLHDGDPAAAWSSRPHGELMEALSYSISGISSVFSRIAVNFIAGGLVTNMRSKQEKKRKKVKGKKAKA